MDLADSVVGFKLQGSTLMIAQRGTPDVPSQ